MVDKYNNNNQSCSHGMPFTLIYAITILAVAIGILLLLALAKPNHSYEVALPQNLTAGSQGTVDKKVVELHLNNAQQAVKEGNDTKAILEIISALRYEHQLGNSTGISSSDNNQTTTRVERNMGAMSNKTTGLNLTNPFG